MSRGRARDRRRAWPREYGLGRRTHAHALTHVGEGAAGDLARALGAGRQDALEPGLVGAQLRVALAHRREIGGDLFGDRPLEVAVAGALELALDVAGVGAADDGEDVDQIRDTGLLGRLADVAARVGDGAAELLSHRVGLVEHVDGPPFAAAGRRHLRLG